VTSSAPFTERERSSLKQSGVPDDGAASRHGNTSYVSLLLAEGSDPWKVERAICEDSSLVSRCRSKDASRLS
jgi:hypothetical protein